MGLYRSAPPGRIVESMTPRRPIMAGRQGGRAPVWLALLLAAMLSLAPAIAVAAPASDMSRSAGPSCPMSGEEQSGPAMICAVAGGCVILPVSGPLVRPVVRRPELGAPPAVAIAVGWNQAPEPPPPRAVAA